MKALILAGIALPFCTEFGRCQGLETDLQIKPDLNLQRRLEEVTDQLLDAKLSTPEKLAAVGSLSEPLREAGDEAFFGQLFYFYCRHDGPGNINEGKKASAATIVRVLDLSHLAIVKVAMRYVYAENKRLDSIARGWLAQVEGQHPQEPYMRNYSYYESVLTKDQLHLPLVKYMYEQGPWTAVLVMARIHRDKPNQYREVVWAEHVVSDALWKKRHRFVKKDAAPPKAVAELEELSRHEAWWARLYVAEILHLHPEFQTAEMVERLKDDQHQLVRNAISRKR